MSEQPQNPQDSNEQRSQTQRVVNIYKGNYNESIGNDSLLLVLRLTLQSIFACDISL
ncbi:MAG: hypothetical protein AAGA80_08880 [Cyanobacteria bacterium P01_F01_bin.143]